MHTKPKIGDFVRDKNRLIRGFVVGEGVILYKGEKLPSYRVKTASGQGLMSKEDTVIINRDGFAWAEWLRLYRTGKVKI